MTPESSMPINAIIPQKWYRQFWPWFLIVLPGSVVIASIATLVIAITHGDNLVRDDYYKDGLAINRYLQQDEIAQQLQLSASGRVTAGFIEITLSSSKPHSYKHLLLTWQHPTDADRDFKTVLLQDSPKHYSGQITENLSGRWYLALEDFDSKEDSRWRLRTEFNTDLSQHFAMNNQTEHSEAQ
tara:strand:+ start:625 stop:1176 length:552 start_codon:yes stop_codon:yes gene_type:complete